VKRFPACVLATAVVPWTPTWELDEELFQAEVAALLAADYCTLYIFGTAGEGYAVTDEQFQRIVEVFSNAMRGGGAEPMVGVISLSLAEIVARIEAGRSLGVRRFQISLPSWGELDVKEVRVFFDEVLGRFEDCEFLHYNLLRAKRLVTPAEYAAIAADHPNLVATKNSTDSMARVRGLLDEAPLLQHFLNERGFLYGSLIGECGLLASVATTNLKMGRHYFEVGRTRKVEMLVALEKDLAGIGAALRECAGGGRIDGAYDKVLWKLHDARFPLRLLPPYQAAPEDAADKLEAFLRERYPDWAPSTA
jgi:dihydrodipicolinate synthase/N-acetylneuraminate lyase